MSDNAARAALRRLAAGESLSAEEIAAAFGLVMRGEVTPAQTGGLLMALRVKGETSTEVAGVAQALREAMIRLPADRPDELVDTCGTGGGRVTTFNISTAAALTAAAAGVRVAKHGNRSFTSACGSADVLEALGIPMETDIATMSGALAQAGIVFMFAPLMHPAMRHVGPVRRELGVPTVMNLVGPLANPAGAGRQVIGVADQARVPLIAGALRNLGTRHALVVHGEPGMDEVSPLGITRVTEIRDGDLAEWTIDPGDFDFTGMDAAELAGGSPADNAQLILEVLSGAGRPAANSAVILNAAAALYVGGLASTYEAGVDLAASTLESGAALDTLARLKAAYGPPESRIVR